MSANPTPNLSVITTNPPTPDTVPPGPTAQQAGRWVHTDLRAAARVLYIAAATARRGGDPAGGDQADAIDRVRADLLAVLAGRDTPSELEYADLAADASALADEVDALRDENAELRAEMRAENADNERKSA